MANSPLESAKYRAIFFGVWLVIALLQTATLTWFGVLFELALGDAFISSALLAAACWLISSNLEYYRPQQARYFYIGLWCLLLAVFYASTLYYLLPMLLETDAAYEIFLLNSLPVRFSIGLLMIGWMAMISILWYNQQEQQASLKRKSDTEKLAREAELYKLRLQLQPHFLFNSLNSINALIGFQPQEARKMVQQLSEFLRSTLRKDDTQPVLLAEELQTLELYLEIEKMRFGHRLQTEILADETSRTMKLPPMLLQPLVENAIKFGLYDTTGQVTISLQTKALENTLEISIRNPYDPQTATKRQGTGFGLNGVQRRLYLLFARHDLLQTRAENHFFTSTLIIPQTL
ncbi:histidine kinase [Adhaeribacter sp. BT258]|uniref:Histidine kinase n=1 Tax=Adhaeribacter terrigena TaxID=2793070 RepID=A0ABS1C447_9BACT|nr:histidine kinase [Adhaeribacter terrigena]MBK0404130.1 histidine kinase [Adhaeribacter terrigena]